MPDQDRLNPAVTERREDAFRTALELDISDESYRARFVTVPEIVDEWMQPQGGLSGKHILDFGCGRATAALSIALRHPTAQVFGIDIHPDVHTCLADAKEHLGLEKLPPNLHLLQIRPGTWPFPAASFDIIYSWSVFNHIAQPILPMITGQLNNALRSDGRLFVQIAPLYYSSGGSNLLPWIPERWGHLLTQQDLYHEKLRKAVHGDAVLIEALWNMYETLNKITSQQLTDILKAGGFSVLRDHYTQEAFEFPSHLGEVYQPNTLLTDQIALLCEVVDRPAAMLQDSFIVEESVPSPENAARRVTTCDPAVDFANRFCTLPAAEHNAFAIHRGGWKFDYDKLTHKEIIANINSIGMTRYVADVFPDFSSLAILELGSSDGYYSAGLEFAGATNITAIDGNIDAFLRSLILKNNLGLTTKFLLGDFTQYLASEKHVDLIYASGVLYHLKEPIEFLARCAEVAPRLYLWTHYYDEAPIAAHPLERISFDLKIKDVAYINGQPFRLYRRYYERKHVDDPKYAGGLRAYANWLSKDDLFRALRMLGYRIERRVPDICGGTPAINIVASQPGVRINAPHPTKAAIQT